jgi:hypothetical protein
MPLSIAATKKETLRYTQGDIYCVILSKAKNLSGFNRRSGEFELPHRGLFSDFFNDGNSEEPLSKQRRITIEAGYLTITPPDPLLP